MSVDPFRTLGIDPSFELDLDALDTRHRDLSAALHPDRYATKPANERRMALDRAINVNTAWRQLRDPVQRAERLLEHHGIAISETTAPKASPTLLMEMMEVREELSEAKQARDLDRVGKLGGRMTAKKAEVIEALRLGFVSADGNVNTLRTLLPTLGELRYLKRFFEEVEAIEEQLLD
jgi:molecular chaperone HscB